MMLVARFSMAKPFLIPGAFGGSGHVASAKSFSTGPMANHPTNGISQATALGARSCVGLRS